MQSLAASTLTLPTHSAWGLAAGATRGLNACRLRMPCTCAVCRPCVAVCTEQSRRESGRPWERAADAPALGVRQREARVRTHAHRSECGPVRHHVGEGPPATLLNMHGLCHTTPGHATLRQPPRTAHLHDERWQLACTAAARQGTHAGHNFMQEHRTHVPGSRPGVSCMCTGDVHGPTPVPSHVLHVHGAALSAACPLPLLSPPPSRSCRTVGSLDVA